MRKSISKQNKGDSEDRFTPSGNRLTIRELCHIAMFAAIIAVCAQITVPVPAIPFTLQTFAIPLAGVVLGKRNGTLAVLVYVFLGLVGVPIFAGFQGGVGMIFGKTGGFILSFPLMAFTAGIGASALKPPKPTKSAKQACLWLTLWLVIGAVINYICGMLMFSFVTSNSLIASFGFVVVPFIPTAIIKIMMVVVLGKTIRQTLVRIGVLERV